MGKAPNPIKVHAWVSFLLLIQSLPTLIPLKLSIQIMTFDLDQCVPGTPAQPEL